MASQAASRPPNPRAASRKRNPFTTSTVIAPTAHGAPRCRVIRTWGSVSPASRRASAEQVPSARAAAHPRRDQRGGQRARQVGAGEPQQVGGHSTQPNPGPAERPSRPAPARRARRRPGSPPRRTARRPSTSARTRSATRRASSSAIAWMAARRTVRPAAAATVSATTRSSALRRVRGRATAEGLAVPEREHGSDVERRRGVGLQPAHPSRALQVVERVHCGEQAGLVRRRRGPRRRPPAATLPRPRPAPPPAPRTPRPWTRTANRRPRPSPRSPTPPRRPAGGPRSSTLATVTHTTSVRPRGPVRGQEVGRRRAWRWSQDRSPAASRA